jgi:uncharacterized protein YecE (DUF72 family)
MHAVQIGTCGWSYKEWSGVFYPDDLAPVDFLSHYAERYPVVEVDSTFYRSPSLKVAQGWRDRTPAGFGFSLKVPQVITHEKVLLDCRKELGEFMTAARVLEDKLRCCVLQFAYFNRSAFSSLDPFMERLDRFLEGWPRDVPVAVEVRNKNWINAKLLDCLRKYRAAYVLADQAWMPAPRDLIKKLDLVTGPFAYVRLLGNREEVDALTKTLDHIVIDRTEQVAADAEAIDFLRERVPVLAFVNNHFAGYAPDTVRHLHEALARTRQ